MRVLVSPEAKTGPGTRIPYSTAAAAAVVALRLNERLRRSAIRISAGGAGPSTRFAGARPPEGVLGDWATRTGCRSMGQTDWTGHGGDSAGGGDDDVYS